MKKPWITNKALEHWLRGPPKYFFLFIIGTFFVAQVVYYAVDLKNFTKYYDLRGDYLGQDDFITYLFKPIIRADKDNIVMTVGGDLRYGPKLMNVAKNGNLSEPLADLIPIFNSSDINILTLDGPITTSQTPRTCTRTEKEFNRCCTEDCFWKNDGSILPALKEIGINGFSVENDHIFDFGREGIEDTLYFLRKILIPYSGLGYRTLYRLKDCDVTVYSYNWAYQGDSFYDRVLNLMTRDMKARGTGAIIVFMHGGDYNGHTKTDFQQEFARTAIDNGASIVIGTHSKNHQESETYKNKKIYYGLGSIFNENSKASDSNEFTLLNFEIQQCRDIVNIQEIKAQRDPKSMQISII